MKDFALGVLEDLREKRLWPVALVLALALVGAPVVLLKDAPEERAAGGGALAGAGAKLPAIGYDATGLAGSSELGSFDSKDPFRSRADAPKDASALADGGISGAPGVSAGGLGAGGTGIDADGPVGDPGGSGSSDLGAGGSGSGSGASPASGGGSGASKGGKSPSSSPSASPGGSGGGSPQPPSSKPPKPQYYTFAADLSFGLRGAERRYRSLEAVAPLVGRRGDVVVVYLGQSPEGDSVFLVNQEFEVSKGKDNCRSNCAFVYLRSEGGRSEVVLRGEDGAEYRLDLHGVRRVVDDRQSSSQSISKGEKRAAKADSGSRSKRAQQKTYFDFRIPLISGRRR